MSNKPNKPDNENDDKTNIGVITKTRPKTK